MEAMVFALRVLNDEKKKRRKFGAVFIDTCSTPTSAIQTVIKTIAEMFPGARKNIVGAVGASYTSVSVKISPVLQTFGIPMVSYASTSARLSDKNDHALFARVIPSDKDMVNWEE